MLTRLCLFLREQNMCYLPSKGSGCGSSHSKRSRRRIRNFIIACINNPRRINNHDLQLGPRVSVIMLTLTVATATVSVKLLTLTVATATVVVNVVTLTVATATVRVHMMRLVAATATRPRVLNCIFRAPRTRARIFSKQFTRFKSWTIVR